MRRSESTAVAMVAAVALRRFDGGMRQPEVRQTSHGWLSRLASSLATEHVCAPPDARFVAVPTELRLARADCWTCPECEQVHVPVRTTMPEA